MAGCFEVGQKITFYRNFQDIRKPAQTGAGAKMRNQKNQRQSRQVHGTPSNSDGVF